MCTPEDSIVRGVCDKEEYARQFFCKYYGIDIPKTQEYCSKPNLKKEILNFV